MYRIIGLLVLSALTLEAFPQLLIRGKVLDQATQQPLGYANIGILGTPVGTLTNVDGSFTLSIHPRYLQDSLVFSALGYGRKSLPVSLVLTQSTIYLAERITILPRIDIVGHQGPWKAIHLGNEHVNTGWLENDSLYAGAAMALLIDMAGQPIEYPYYLTKARLRIWKNTLPTFKARIRLYDLDSLSGLPGKDLLHQSIILTTTIRQGWLSVDLSSYALMLSKSRFFLAFEWIVNEEDRRWISQQYRAYKRQHPERMKVNSVLIDERRVAQEIWNYQGFLAGTAFGVSYNNATTSSHFQCYTRKSSFDLWRRATGILTAQLTVSHQLSSNHKTH
jgi:hypothetical protein